MVPELRLCKRPPGQVSGGQSGSKRQVHARTPEWLWREYKQHVGEGPVADTAHAPLLLSLPDLCSNDPDGDFDGLVLKMLTSSDWDPNRFNKLNGVDKIRKKIDTETLRQYGSHIATTEPGYLAATLDRIRKIQKEWDTVAKEGKHKHTPWEPPKTPNHLQLTKSQGDSARKKTIDDKYKSMEREVQINVVNNLSVDDQVRLEFHVAMVWYNSRVSSGAA